MPINNISSWQQEPPRVFTQFTETLHHYVREKWLIFRVFRGSSQNQKTWLCINLGSLYDWDENHSRGSLLSFLSVSCLKIDIMLTTIPVGMSVESAKPEPQLQRPGVPKRISNLDPDLGLIFKISN